MWWSLFTGCNLVLSPPCKRRCGSLLRLATCVKILACIENLQVYKKTDSFTRLNASTTLLKGDETRLRPLKHSFFSSIFNKCFF